MRFLVDLIDESVIDGIGKLPINGYSAQVNI